MNAHVKEIDHTKSNFTENQIKKLLYYIDFKVFIMEIAGRKPTDN
jgi:hypothetical protein